MAPATGPWGRPGQPEEALHRNSHQNGLRAKFLFCLFKSLTPRTALDLFLQLFLGVGGDVLGDGLSGVAFSVVVSFAARGDDEVGVGHLEISCGVLEE